MTGVELLAFVKRRLAEAGQAADAGRDAELYGHLTDARDTLLLRFARDPNVPIGRTKVTLEQDANDDRVWALPGATADPLRVWSVRDLVTREPFTPSTGVDLDAGDYQWEDIRQLRMSDDADVENGVQVIVTLGVAAITAATTAAQVGLPTPTHPCIGLQAAVFALTADEESDATNARRHLDAAIEAVESLYGDYDANGGLALRSALMEGLGALTPDTIY